MNKVLVVAAHPDDEVLGCGATIAKHRQAGDEVHVVILAEGLTSRGDTGQDFSEDLTRLRASAEKAHRILGSSSLELQRLPDNRMDSVDLLDIVKVVEAAIAQRQPSIVYTHHGGDLNIDHQKTHEAVLTACRPQPNGLVKKLLFFEVASSTDWQSYQSAPFVPNWFVDISSTLPLKMQALQAYQSEMRAWPHARSIEALEHLAKWRGASVGVNAAEAFMLGRQID